MNASSRSTQIVAGLAGSGVFIFLVGRYLQKLYGFDPPYVVFWAGFFMQPVGILCAVGALVVLVARLTRRK